MENASKALIIAGAILLSILIISLGIMIYNQASGVVNNNAMSEVEIAQFNSKFTQYEGDSVKGSTVNALLQTVLANNVSQDTADRKVMIGGGNAKGEEGLEIRMDETCTWIPVKAIAGSTYTVKCNYGRTGATKGLVTYIIINNK